MIDRVVAKFGVTVRLRPKHDDYEFMRVDFEYHTDVKPDETVAEANTRAFTIVKEETRVRVDNVWNGSKD